MRGGSLDFCDFSAGPWPYCPRVPVVVFWSASPVRKLCAACRDSWSSRPGATS